MNWSRYMTWRGTGVAVVALVFVGLLGVVTGELPFAEQSEHTERTQQSVYRDGAGFLTPYTKDAHTVYYRNQAVPGADPATFTVLDPYYAKDSAHVYFDVNPLAPSSSISALTGADPNTFTLCDTGNDRDDCGKDAQNVYLEGRAVSGADPRTFSALDTHYAKDANHVFFDGTLISGADAKTFALVGGVAAHDAQDAHHFYLSGKVVQ